MSRLPSPPHPGGGPAYVWITNGGVTTETGSANGWLIVNRSNTLGALTVNSMIPTIAVLWAVALTSVGACLPGPHDKDGWGLRIHNCSVRGPYVTETISHFRFTVTLINFSKETRTHDALEDAQRAGNLQVRITRPDGRDVPAVSGCWQNLPKGPFAQSKLRPGEFSSHDLPLKGFGYIYLGDPGRHSIQATMTIDGKKVTSPPFELEVVAVTQEMVLTSHAVPLEGVAATQPPEMQSRPVVKQVKVGDRTLLIYVRRIAELPGRAVDLKVQGAYGSGNPLTITYRETTYTKWTTTLVINSNNGSPWTPEAEKHRQEKLKREAKLSTDKN